MRNTFLFLIIVIGFGRPVWAESFSFLEVWSQINNSSPAQEASRLQTKTLSESEARASRHWLPRVYIDAKSYQTNDPGASFFGVLQQRAVQASDFNPNLLNQPEANIYTRGALGVDLPVYEGGMKSAQVDFFKHSVKAQQKVVAQVQIEQYSHAGLAYGSMVALTHQKKRLETLNSEILRLLKNYKLGNKSNPVGYSGLLGMKSIANRLDGLIIQNQAALNTMNSSLYEMGFKETQWSPENFSSAVEFVDKYLTPIPSVDGLALSYKSESIKEDVKASAEMANMEKAKFLPRVGIFAESYIFNGNRATANGYNAGLYLQWNLFDPKDYGSLSESRLKSMVAEKFSEAAEQQERIEKKALAESFTSLQKNIALLSGSHKLLVEQSKVTETLFQNGSINALQMVEVLNRRIDLSVQQVDAEKGLIEAASQSISRSKFDISARLAPLKKNFEGKK